MRQVLLTAFALSAAAVIALAAGGYALLHSPLDVPRATRVHHDDFAFVVESIEYRRQLAGSRDVYVRLRVENDAKVVGYQWEPSTAYVLDGSGRRYAPDARTSTAPKNVGAGDRADATLVFAVPSDARDLRLAFWDGIMMGDVFDRLKYARLRLRLGCDHRDNACHPERAEGAKSKDHAPLALRLRSA